MRDKQYFFHINQRGGQIRFKEILVWSYLIGLYATNRTTTVTEISEVLHMNRQTLRAVLDRLVELGLLEANSMVPKPPSPQQTAWFYPIRNNSLPWHKQFGYFKCLFPADKRLSMADAAVWSKIHNLKNHPMTIGILARELGLARATVVRSLATLRTLGLVSGRTAVYNPAFWLDLPKAESEVKKPTLVATIKSWYPESKPFASYYYDNSPTDRKVFAIRIKRVTNLLKEFAFGRNLRKKFWRNLWDKSKNPELFEMFLIHATAVINIAAEKHRSQHGGSPTYSFVRRITEMALFDLAASRDWHNWEPVRERLIYGKACSV